MEPLGGQLKALSPHPYLICMAHVVVSLTDGRERLLKKTEVAKSGLCPAELVPVH